MTKNECSGIWVFAEQRNGILDRTPLELLAKAMELKETTGEEITAVLMGYEVEALADTLIAHGADKVIVAQHENLKNYSARPYQKVLAELCEKYKPSIFVFGATAIGRDVAPRVMYSLGTGLTADAVDLGFDDEGAFVQTTPAFGGTLLAHIAIPELRPQMVTVRAHVFDVAEPDESRKGEVIVETVSVDADPDYVVVEQLEKVRNGVSINDADVLVCGGRGIKKEEDIGLLRELADLLGGEVACARPLVDNGWLDHDLQIGQSGTTVKPKFIVNIGISGSVQYVVGMEKSQTIATINTYERADMFGVSHYGAVADYSKLLPEIIEEIKRRKANPGASVKKDEKPAYEITEIVVKDHVATITMNQPASLNPMSTRSMTELLAAMKECAANDDVRVVVLKGAGRAFCGGGDIRYMKAEREKEGFDLGDLVGLVGEVIAEIRKMPKPVIAAVQGAAAGGGFNLALACDTVIAADNAKFIQAFVGIGLAPDTGGMYWLPRMIGPARAFEMMSTGRPVKAAEALELGLVAKVVPLEELDSAVDALSQVYVNGPTLAYAELKNMMNASIYGELDKFLPIEKAALSRLGSSEDFLEGMTAFLEKRKANYQGK